jgi:hypothetical protein
MRLVLEDDDGAVLKKEQRKLYLLYIGLYVSLILQLFPGLSLQLVSAVSFLVLLLWVKRMKRKNEKDTFLGSHAAYLLLTLRVFLYVFLAGTVGGYFYLQSVITPTEMEVFTRMLLSAMMGGDTLPQAFGYIRNIHPFATFTFIFLGFILPMLYITYRFVWGGLCVYDGREVPKPIIPLL